MDRIHITIPYRGAESISVNHFKVGGNMRWKYTDEAASTRDEITVKIKNALAWTKWYPRVPLKVTIQGWFKNRRNAIDLHNAIKLVADAVESATGVNDKYIRVETMEPHFHSEQPKISITVEQMETTPGPATS